MMMSYGGTSTAAPAMKITAVGLRAGSSSSFCSMASGRIFSDWNTQVSVSGGFSAATAGSEGCGSKLLPRSSRAVRAMAEAGQGTEKSYGIVILPGDGIGPEIMSVAVDVLRAVGDRQGLKFEIIEKHVGGAAIDATGVPLPDETLAACQQADAVLLAAIGGYKWDTIPAHLRPEQGLLALRSGLGVFANLRPAIVLPQLADSSTLKREIAEGVDIMVVRELIGGIYFGKPKGFGVNEEGHKYAYNTMVYSIPEIERIARVAFETARKRNGKLCSVDKANVLAVSQLWRENVTRMGAEEYPDVELSHMYVDNAAMQLIRNPKQFDTIVTGNLFGDILSDISAMLSGSIGMLASASISASGPGLYEPVHGSAPDIAGQDKANPLAQVLSVAMMLRYGLGEEQAATAIESAVNEVLDKGYRTGDISSPGKTSVGCKQMGELLLGALEASSRVAVLRANRTEEVNEMWRRRNVEVENERRQTGNWRRNKSPGEASDVLENSALDSRHRYEPDDQESADGALKDEELEQFLHSRLKRERGAVGSRMDGTGPYLPSQSGNLLPDERVKDDWEERIVGPQVEPCLQHSCSFSAI